MGRLAEIASQSKRFWSGLSPARRVTLIFVAVAATGAILVVHYLGSRVEWAPLFTNLAREDNAAIAQRLREQKVDFQVEGNALLVPKQLAPKLRLELAAAGLPKGGGVGFELFDKRTLGQSEFTQRLNYRRALMGELSRTISAIQAVERARVHLVIPEKSLFSARREKASASVVLKVHPGRRLGAGQVQGIVNLVASAVEGLSPENITLVDEAGRILWRPRAGGQEAALQEARLEKEQVLERRAMEIVERIVGAGRAVVRVTADVDLSRTETTVEDYDPEVRVLRSEQATRERQGATARTPATAGGVPGSQSNLVTARGATAPAPSPLPPGGRESTVRNYEIKRTTQRTVSPGGRVRKLSVAVLVDGTYQERGGKRVYEPRGAAVLAKIDALVKGAVGFQADRGDTVTVQSIPFEAERLPEASVAKAEVAPATWTRYVKWGVMGLAALLLLFLVVRPIIKGIFAPPAAVAAPAQLPAPGSDGAVAQLDAAPSRAEMPSSAKDAALLLVKADPRRAATVVRTWLQQRPEDKPA